MQTKAGGFVITANSGENELMISAVPYYGSTNKCDMVDIVVVYMRILSPHRVRRMTSKLEKVNEVVNMLIKNAVEG
jgi:hypothetical protein